MLKVARHIFLIVLLCGFQVIGYSFDAKSFLEGMNLSGPEMIKVRSFAEKKDYNAALKSWRDKIVQRFREHDFGEYGWHGYAGHSTPCGVVNMLTGVITPKQYYKNAGKVIFIDIYKLSGAPGKGAKANWIVDARKIKDWGSPRFAKYPIQEKLVKTDFFNFEFSKSFVYMYWKSGNETYYKKLLELYADFSANNYDEFYKQVKKTTDFYDDDVKYITRVDWRLNTNGLETGWRLKNFMKGIAGMV
ncbi:MAG: hypothetical protein JXR78_17520, partial [Victivallales bacterium]|nr:hypothetical protein [Victivallales bacterium]